MTRILTAAVVAISLSGCITTKMVNSKMKAGETQDLQVVHHAGFGTPTATPSCPRGVASIAQGRTFGQGFMSGITLGIYEPSTIRVACAN
jgi:hypothetical protein